MKSVGDLFIQISANAQPALEAMGSVESSLSRINRAAHGTEGALRVVANSSESSFGRMAASLLKLVTAYRVATLAVSAYKNAAMASVGVNPATGQAFGPRAAAAVGQLNTQLSRLGPVGVAVTGLIAAGFAKIVPIVTRVIASVAALGAAFGAVKLVFVGIGAAIATVIAGIAGSFKSAQLKESVGAVEAIFKDAAKPVLTFADQVSSAFGRSQKEVLDAATQIGAILKSQGFSEADAATNSIVLLGTAMELAAQRGTTTAQALNAVSAAIRGEADPIERLGISINEALVKKTIEADANLSRLAQTNELAARATARLILIQNQSRDAMGTMSKEAGNLTQQMEKFRGLLSQGFTDLGSGFEPLVTAVVRLSDAFLQLGGGGIATFADAVQVLLSPLEMLINLLASAVEGFSKLFGIAGNVPKLGGELAIPKAAAKNAELEAFEAAQNKFKIEKEYQDRLDGLLTDMADREKQRQAEISRLRERQAEEFMDAISRQESIFAKQKEIQAAMRRPEILNSAAEVFAKNLGAGVEEDQLKELQEINQGIKGFFDQLPNITGLG